MAHIKNEKVLKRMNIDRQLLKTVKRMKIAYLKWKLQIYTIHNKNVPLKDGVAEAEERWIGLEIFSIV